MRYLLYIFILLNSLSFANCLGQKDSIYVVAEVMPEFPGGMKELMNFISNNINYPSDAKDNGIEGKVYIRFVVEKNGKVTNPKIVKSSGNEALDKEGLRVIALLPAWKPGKQNGEEVAVQFNAPVNFKLNIPLDSTTNKMPEHLSSIYEPDHYYKQGIKSFNEGDYKNANYYFALAIDVNPRDIDALYNRGIVLRKLNINDSACYCWYKIRYYGKNDAEELIKKYCASVAPPPIDSNEKYTVVEEMPEPPGGILVFYKYVGKNIIVPKKVREGNAAGKCHLKFVVETDGSMSNIEVLKGVRDCPECDLEAIRVLSSYKDKWKPGKQKGKAVRVYYNMPIRFE